MRRRDPLGGAPPIMLLLVWLALAQAVLANGKLVSRSRQRLDKRTGQWVDVEVRQLDLGLGGSSVTPTFPAGAEITFITQFTSSSVSGTPTSPAASSSAFSGVAGPSDSPLPDAQVAPSSSSSLAEASPSPSPSADPTPSPSPSASVTPSSSAGFLTLDLTPDSSTSASSAGGLLTLLPQASSSSTSANAPPTTTTPSDSAPASVSPTQSSIQTTAPPASSAASSASTNPASSSTSLNDAASDAVETPSSASSSSLQTSSSTINQASTSQAGAVTESATSTTTSSPGLSSLVLLPTSSDTTVSTSSTSTSTSTTSTTGPASSDGGASTSTSEAASSSSSPAPAPSSSATSTTSVDITSGQFQTTSTTSTTATSQDNQPTTTESVVSSSSASTAPPGPSTTAPPEASSSSSSSSSTVEQPPSSSDQPTSSQASTTQDPVTSNGPSTTQGASTSIASDFSSISSAVDDDFNMTSSTTQRLTTVSPPSTTGSQVTFFTDSSVISSSSAASSSASDSSSNDNYIPTQTWLIVATTTSSSTSSSSGTSTSAPSVSGTDQPSSTTALPTTAQIPSSVPTLIVPQNSIANNPNAGTGKADDPIKDDTFISLLLAADEYPWVFVVNSSDATSQLFNTFPNLIANALTIPVSDVKTYGLQVYQPASWNGDQAGLLTQWLAYIPSDQFDTLNAYLKTQTSPLFTQPGIQGDLAQQINTAYPLAASSGVAITPSGDASQAASSTRTRDIIIGVSVGVGGTLWIALIYWIYRRVKRSNEKAVHKRLSEHMSMFVDDRFAYNDEPQMAYRQRPVSQVPSVAGSDIDDRPSSFYASPLDNDPAMRRQQREADRIQRHSYGSDSGDSYNSQDPFSNSQAASLGHSGHSAQQGAGQAQGQGQGQGQVFGGSWFNAPQGRSQSPPEMRQVNPFEEFVTRSYIAPSGSTGTMGGMNPQRRSALGKPVQKAMISQPTLHASSLEFREY